MKRIFDIENGLFLEFEDDEGRSNTILSGAGAPLPSQGSDGDFYIDTLNYIIYGAKNTVWGTGVNLLPKKPDSPVSIKSIDYNGTELCIGLTDGTEKVFSIVPDSVADISYIDSKILVTFSNGKTKSFEIELPLPPNDGQDGKDGRDVEIEVSEGVLKYRLTGDEEWKNLYRFNEVVGGSGVVYLKYLSDVSANSPTNGQVLGYNSATQKWEPTTNDAGNGLPPGGTTNQALRKIDNTDYNAYWNTLGTMADQNADAVDIVGGQINGTVIGSFDPTIGIFTSLKVILLTTPGFVKNSNTGVITGGNRVNALTDVDNLGTMAFQDDTAVDINGGTIDGTAIGGATPSSGAFTTVTATGDVLITNANPKLDLYETDQSANAGRWGVQVSGSDFYIYTQNDLGTFGQNLLFGTRSGTAVTGLTIVPALTVAAMSSAGFVKNNASGLLSGGNSITSGDLPAIALNDLSDVTITTPVTNETLSWNGSAWVNTNSLSLSGLSVSGDVTFSTNLFHTNAGVYAVGIGTLSPAAGTFQSNLPALFKDTVTIDSMAVAGIVKNSAAGLLSGGNTIGTTDIANDAVTFAKIQNITSDRLLGRDTASSGDTEELTVGGGLEFTGSGGIQTSAFTGDVTKSAGGTALTIANDAVTYAKMQNVSATDRILGRSSAGSGDVQEITCTSTARSLLDDSSTSAMRTTLGLGSIATQNASAVNIDGGSIDGTDIGVSTVGTGRFSGLESTTATTHVASSASNRHIIWLGCSSYIAGSPATSARRVNYDSTDTLKLVVSSTDTGGASFNFDINHAYHDRGADLKIYKITVYWYKKTSGSYIDSFTLFRTNLGSNDYTTVVTSGTNYGSGSTGYRADDVYNSSVSLTTDAPYILNISTENGGTADSARIYGIRIECDYE